MVFSEYGNYCLLFFDITLNCLEKNMYANLLTRCDDACVITPCLFIYLLSYMKKLLDSLLLIMREAKRGHIMHVVNIEKSTLHSFMPLVFSMKCVNL